MGDPDTAVINADCKVPVINEYVQKKKWQDEENFTGQFKKSLRTIWMNST